MNKPVLQDKYAYTVYFLQEEGRDRIKIGRTRSLRKRIQNLQVGNSDKLKLIAYLPDQCKEMEQHIHGVCERFRLEGEWFNLQALTEHLLNHPYYRERVKLV